MGRVQISKTHNKIHKHQLILIKTIKFLQNILCLLNDIHFLIITFK